jgi:hypothetical protein
VAAVAEAAKVDVAAARRGAERDAGGQHRAKREAGRQTADTICPVARDQKSMSVAPRMSPTLLLGLFRGCGRASDPARGRDRHCPSAQAVTAALGSAWAARPRPPSAEVPRVSDEGDRFSVGRASAERGSSPIRRATATSGRAPPPSSSRWR